MPDQPRFTIEHTDKTTHAKRAWHCEHLDECKRIVRDDVREPVRIFDRQVRQRGTLYPSGAMRWNPPQ